MEIVFVLIWLLPPMALFAAFVSFCILLRSRSAKALAGAVVLLLPMGVFLWDGGNWPDLLLGGILPCALAAGVVVAVVGTLETRGRSIAAIAGGTFCVAWLYIALSSDRRIEITLAEDTVVSGTPFEATVTTGLWPLTGPVFYMADGIAPSRPADYSTPDRTGRMMIGEKDALIGPSRKAFGAELPPGRYRLTIGQEEGTVQSHTSLRRGWLRREMDVTVTDADGIVGREFAEQALREAITRAFTARAVPGGSHRGWVWGRIETREDGLWCLSGRRETVLATSASACIPPGGVDGAGSGFRIADATDIAIAPLSEEDAARVALFRAAVPEALKRHLERRPDDRERTLRFLSGEEMAGDSGNAILDRKTGEWRVFLSFIPRSRNDYGGMHYRLLPDGTVRPGL